jgi:hypothetical protein
MPAPHAVAVAWRAEVPRDVHGNQHQALDTRRARHASSDRLILCWSTRPDSNRRGRRVHRRGRVHTRWGLIGHSTPSRWLVANVRLSERCRLPAPIAVRPPKTQQPRSPKQNGVAVMLEHETRFELATLTLARRMRNLLRARNNMGISEPWPGRFRQACAPTGMHEPALPFCFLNLEFARQRPYN